MKVIAFMNIYNEKRFLKHIVEGLLLVVDEIHIVDGAYELFPHKNKDGSSDDGTVELCLELEKKHKSVHFHACKKPYYSEITKRNEMFRFGEEGDWFFIIDGDELLGPELADVIKEIRESDYNFVRVFFMDSNIGYASAPRFIKYKKGMRYRKNHYTIHCGDNKLIEDKTIPKFALIHINHLEDDRIKNKEKYVGKLITGKAREKGIKPNLKTVRHNSESHTLKGKLDIDFESLKKHIKNSV